MTENYAQMTEISGSKYIAKIDPDCLILNSNWADYLKESKAMFALSKNGFPYGGIYLFESSFVGYLSKALHEEKFLNRIKRTANLKKFLILEDYSFWFLAKKYFGESEVKGFWRGEYWVTDDGLKEKLDSLRKENLVCNFGLGKPDAKSCEDRMKLVLRRLA